jgi:hypothetical protein
VRHLHAYNISSNLTVTAFAGKTNQEPIDDDDEDDEDDDNDNDDNDESDSQDEEDAEMDMNFGMQASPA